MLFRSVAVSSQIKNYLVRNGVDPQNITVIENAVESRSTIKRNADEVSLVSRMEPEKGILDVVNTWKSNPQLPNLHLIGSGNLGKKIESVALECSNITYHGKLDKRNVEEINAFCKISLTPSLWEEPFGRNLAEALSRGQVVISTPSVESSRTIKSGVNGFLINNLDSDLVTAIHKGLEIDNVVHVKHSQTIWQEFYSPQVIMEKWGRFYSGDSE